MSEYEKIVKLWQSYNLNDPHGLDRYLSSFRVLFAYNSGRIENEEITYHDTREIFENGKVSGYTGNTKALFEQENQKLCYEYLKKKIVDKEPITVDLIQEIHRILTSGTYDERRYIENGERPGEFKKHDYVTGIHEVGSFPEDVEADLQDLLEEMNEYSNKDVLKVAAYFHARFEYIHPFADGNGRVGRTLLNYFLMTHSHPPIIIYDEDKNGYYKALEHYDQDEDLISMHSFLKNQAEKTWAKTLERQERRNKER
ncbi:Fic family protein [Scatolibacter rhodanostii]|uniref:Fic family protein n=1 Tax=Scatolibacter rhodanostii TaxID=2014781 RepID=UPI000C080A98|nr:Fic family protein [Scatolibacter rhodanostii]